MKIGEWIEGQYQEREEIDICEGIEMFQDAAPDLHEGKGSGSETKANSDADQDSDASEKDGDEGAEKESDANVEQPEKKEEVNDNGG